MAGWFSCTYIRGLVGFDGNPARESGMIGSGVKMKMEIDGDGDGDGK